MKNKKAMKGLRISAEMFKANLPAMGINDLVAGHELEIDAVSVEGPIEKPYLNFNVGGRLLKVSLRRFCTWLEQDTINDILNTDDYGALLLPTKWKVVATEDTYDDYPIPSYNLFTDFQIGDCNMQELKDGGVRLGSQSRQKVKVIAY